MKDYKFYICCRSPTCRHVGLDKCSICYNKHINDGYIWSYVIYTSPEDIIVKTNCQVCFNVRMIDSLDKLYHHGDDTFEYSSHKQMNEDEISSIARRAENIKELI